MGCCTEANTNLNTMNPYFVSEYSPERKEFFVNRNSYSMQLFKKPISGDIW